MHWLAVLLGMALAEPERTGSEWLSHIDEVASVDDAHMVLDVTVVDRRGQSAHRTIEIWQRGDEQRLVRMVEPSRLHGIGLLVTHADTLHLFLPQYPPARRVVGSSRADAFMGTDFALDDLARIRYSEDYTATIVGQQDGLTQLMLHPTNQTGSASVHAWVREDGVIRRLEHLDADGEVMRRISMEDVRLEGETLLAHRLVVDDVKRGRQTEAVLQRVEINAGISPELFTVSSLENP